MEAGVHSLTFQKTAVKVRGYKFTLGNAAIDIAPLH